MNNLATFDNRVSVQFMSINSDITRFDSVFNSENSKHILLALSFLFSILILVGRIIELNDLVLEDRRIVLMVILVKIFYWTAKSLAGKKL